MQPKEKTYSYHEVEDILCRAIETINYNEIMRNNDIQIKCTPDFKERGVNIAIRNKNTIIMFPFLMKGGAE